LGKSLALNLAGKGVPLAVYNRHVPGKEEGIAEAMLAENADVSNLKGFDRLDEFVQSLEKPRKILLMIYAGAVDSQIEELLPWLEQGDVIIDGGNSFYRDTSRRAAMLEGRGIYYLGTGISGGEEGARNGPSIMAGGSKAAYELSGKYLELIAARNERGKACAAYVGPDGAGHFVKMVHNGIEYAEMQVLAEVYHLLRHFVQLSPAEIVTIFSNWQKGDLGSYLLEITIEILQKEEDGSLLIDRILDQAEQKGTGGLSVNAALEYGVPYGPLSEAVMARALSAMKNKRIEASVIYNGEPLVNDLNKPEFVSRLKNAYQACRIINHEIGFTLMRQASIQNTWNLELKEIASVWTNGCIIRSVLMNEIADILSRNDSILIAAEVVPVMKSSQKDFGFIVGQGLQNNIALPVLSSALNY
jgi:6-phosphogluconate dehydrogenase